MNYESRIDEKQIMHMTMTLKKQHINISTQKQFDNTLKLFEFMKKHAPMSVIKGPSQLEYVLEQMMEQKEKFKLSLNDLVRLQNIVLVSLQKPTLLFEEILAHEGSLALQVEKPVLKTFVQDVIARMMQH